MKSRSLQTLLLQLVSVTPAQAALTLGLMLLVGLTEGVGLLMLIPLLQLVGVDAGQGAVGQFVEVVRSAFATLNLPLGLGVVLVLYVLVITMNTSLQRWATLSTSVLQNHFAAQLKNRLYQAITRANWLFFSRSRSSDFVHIMTTETVRVLMATDALLALLVTGIMALVYVVLALLLSPVLTLLTLVVGGALVLLFRRQTLLAHALGEQRVRADKDVYAALTDSLAGMRLIKSHGLEARQVALFSSFVGRLVTVAIAAMKNHANLSFGLKTSSAMVLALFVYVALTVFNVPAAGLLVLLYLFARMVPMVSNLQSQYQGLLSTLPAFDAVIALQARCDEAAEALPQKGREVTFTQHITLERVSFAYEGSGDYPVLSELDLTLRAGETTAVVGSSGSGKSTLADLLIGLIRPSNGLILIDGQPLTPERLQSWRERIAYVPQEAFMFHDTVRANLLLMNPAASEEELWQALRFASAADFVVALPQGLDTVLGDRGIRLSGGERQRLALARAILRRPSLLVLDEATSALDAENEQQIQKAIEGLRGKITILVIAHRLSTIRNADVIHVLERGQLVESGDWQSLSNRNGGRFRALCQEQGLIAKGLEGVAS